LSEINSEPRGRFFEPACSALLEEEWSGSAWTEQTRPKADQKSNDKIAVFIGFFIQHLFV
jgi:hypothetical protein